MVGKVLKRLQPVAFNVVFSSVEPVVSVVWKKGELYLSCTSVLVSEEGEKWYEVPLREIAEIEIEELEKETKMNFKFENGTLEVKGKDREAMLALRHFLLPFIGVPSVVG
ncbi:MAG: hypothetical protein QW531_04510 [Thermoplasmata archaeon]